MCPVAIARPGLLNGWLRPSLRRSAARLAWPPLVPGVVSFATLVSVGIADGGLYPRTWRLAAVALLALSVAGLLVRERVVVSGREWGMIAFLAAFGAWTAASVAWSPKADAALLEAERTLAYIAAIVAVAVLTDRASLTPLLGGIAAAITFVCSYGLAIYIFASPPIDPFEGTFLHQPFGYANALGIFAAIGLLLSLGLAFAAKSWAWRTIAVVPLVPLGVALVLTSSVGAWIALAAGLVCFLLLSGYVRSAAALVAIGAAFPLALAALGEPLSQFVRENRFHYWRVAWDQFTANPVLGSGPGTYVDYWLEAQPVPSFTRTAHSLYLETLAELGPVGLGLITLALALPLLALRDRRDALVAGAGAAYAAFVLHTGIEWDWELAAPTLAGLLCGSALLVAGRPAASPLVWRARIGLLAPIIGLALVAALRLLTGPALPFGS